MSHSTEQEHDRTTAPTISLIETGLCSWIKRSITGEQLVYHRGLLARDIGTQGSPLNAAERMRLVRLATLARQASAQGLVHLVQRRHGEDDYSYVMVARTRRRNHPVPRAALQLVTVP